MLLSQSNPPPSGPISTLDTLDDAAKKARVSGDFTRLTIEQLLTIPATFDLGWSTFQVAYTAIKKEWAATSTLGGNFTRSAGGDLRRVLVMAMDHLQMQERHSLAPSSLVSESIQSA
jgi:hypothetical protein